MLYYVKQAFCGFSDAVYRFLDQHHGAEGGQIDFALDCGEGVGSGPLMIHMDIPLACRQGHPLTGGGGVEHDIQTLCRFPVDAAV